MIKAMFFDLDGTLLDDNKKIQQSTMISLSKCKEKGIKLYISTGRVPLLKKMLGFSHEEEQLFHGGVFCNGGCIINQGIKKYKCISKEIVLEIIEAMNSYPGLNISLQMKDELHGFRYPLSEHAYEKWGMNKEETVTLDQCSLDEVVKILIFYENVIDSVTKIEEEFINKVQGFCQGRAMIYLTDEKKLIQIMDNDVNKKEGIESIRKDNGFEKHEVAVFGDDINDMEMLSFYENSVAMGNAEEFVKKAAKMVTKNNTDHGISYAIDNLLHIK